MKKIVKIFALLVVLVFLTMSASAYTLNKAGKNCIRVTYYDSKDQNYLYGKKGATAVAYEIKDLAEYTRWGMKITRSVESIRNQIQSTVADQYLSGDAYGAKSLNIDVHLDEGDLTWYKTSSINKFKKAKDLLIPNIKIT